MLAPVADAAEAPMMKTKAAPAPKFVPQGAKAAPLSAPKLSAIGGGGKKGAELKLKARPEPRRCTCSAPRGDGGLRGALHAPRAAAGGCAARYLRLAAPHAPR